MEKRIQIGLETQASHRPTTHQFLFSVLLVIVLILAGWVRFFGLEWDQGTHLHPDERYLTMVASAIRFPDELSGDGQSTICSNFIDCQRLYWNTSQSPLNPANYEQYASYVYGTLPLFFTRAAGRMIDKACTTQVDQPITVYFTRGVRQLFLGTNALCSEGLYTGYGGIHLVGRMLSAIADLVTLCGLIILARLLYGNRIAILAGLLYAFTVLPIQHAHFFVVDSFAAVFVIWTLVFCVYAYVRKTPFTLIMAGVFTGLAVASKISVWPLAGVVGLSGLLLAINSPTDNRNLLSNRQLFIVFSLLISGILAAVMFRIGQPYAFEGPGFFDVAINPQWMQTMKEIRELMNGQRDVPFGHQWTNRLPVLFPLKNMVVWGMGIPLGLAAWLGWGTMGWQIWKKQRYQHAIPWIWSTLFFAYQSTQWVKSMRYLLPVYPLFVLMAAWFLVRFLIHTKKQIRKKSAHGFIAVIHRAGYLFVVGGTFLWACAFLSIYSQPLTRVAASKWMYEHIPTAITLHTTEDDIQIPVRPSTLIHPEVPVIFRVPVQEHDRWVTSVSLNKYRSLTPEPTILQISINSGLAGGLLDYSGVGYASATIPFTESVFLKGGQQYDLVVELDVGDALELESSVIANEHWDDPLPQRFDGKDPFWNWYQSLESSPSTQMNNYDNDNEEKRTALIAWLDEADYIVLSSNRLYASIPRLPLRYPFTTKYYELLFNGDLGFDLAAEFVSYPTLGDCQFPDQEIPFHIMEADVSNQAPCSIPLPPAEEAFSVYDHPTVMIFAKTDAYSSEKVAALLPESLLDNVQWMTPLEATKNRDQEHPSLLMDIRTRLEQERGGTWSEMFDRSTLQNRYPLLSVLIWWLLLTLLGWLTYPWLFVTFTRLRHRGFGLSKTIGLLVWSYVVWILGSIRLLPFTRLTLWLVFAVLTAAVGVLLIKRWEAFYGYLKREWPNLVRLELLFLGMFVAWVLVRAMNPDLWHTVTGGEKPMDFAYLNAIIKSTWFPPYDPWFAGGKMNYYYFGFVLVAVLVKATGIVPSVAYNLAVAMFYALTGLGVYTVASNLAGGDKRKGHRTGLWAVLLVVILGNMGEARLLFKGYETIGDIHFESLIPGYPATISALVGLYKVVVNKVSLGFRPEWWYWDATRVIPFLPGEVGAINEFPAFTFLYADLHAHMMAFPLTLSALAMMIQVSLSRFPQATETSRRFTRIVHYAFPPQLSVIVLAGLLTGALRATNTWDYPTYLALIALGSLLPLLKAVRNTYQDSDVSQQHRWLIYLRLITPLVIFGIAELLFLPFTRNYAVAYSSFNAWEGSRTPLGIYFIMYGVFLFPIITAAVYSGGQVIHATVKSKGQLPRRIFILFGFSSVVLISVFAIALKSPVAWIVIPLGLVALLFLVNSQTSIRRQIMWLWVGTALALSLGVEVLVLDGDIGRMNTVFKFYLQVWILLGLCASVFLERILHHSLTASAHPEWLSESAYHTFVDLVSVFMALLLFCAGLYPALAIPAKIRDRWAPLAPKSLDGAAFIPYAFQEEHGSRMSLAADYAVIRWLQENVEGSPTIMEAQAEREYLWGARISVHTGLPAVAAWRWHQVQQRWVMPPGTVEARQLDVRLFYNTSNPEKAMSILRKYDVKYVILAPYERAYMVPDGYAKFPILENMGFLSKVFQNEEAVIYQVVEL